MHLRAVSNCLRHCYIRYHGKGGDKLDVEFTINRVTAVFDVYEGEGGFYKGCGIWFQIFYATSKYSPGHQS